MRFTGETVHGVVDDCDGIHANTVIKYYGMDGPQNSIPDELCDLTYEELDELTGAIEEDQEHHIRHDPIEVPKHSCPFETQEDLDVFCELLHNLETQDILPSGYGGRPEEWDEDGYPLSETLAVGRQKATADTFILMPMEIWKPRADQWIRGLDVMYRILENAG